MWFDFLFYFSIINILLVATILFFKKSLITNASKWLALCMLIIAYTQIVTYFYNKGYIESYIYLTYTDGIIFYLYTPAYYHYILNTIGIQDKFSTKKLVHLTPSIPGIIYYVVFLTLPYEQKLTSLKANSCGPLQDYWLILSGIVFQFIYIYLIIKTLKKFEKKYGSKGNNLIRGEIRWTYNILLLYVIIGLSYIGLYHIFPVSTYNFITQILLYFLFFIMYIKYLWYPPILILNSREDINSTDDPNQALSKHKKVCLSPTELTNISTSLHQQMVLKEAFLDKLITIDQVSSLINIPTYKISFFLNNHLNITFNDFVNFFRIKKAITLLNNKKNKIDVISSECGFNSRSSFYNAFKKYTGITPKDFIKDSKIKFDYQKGNNAFQKFLQNNDYFKPDN